ncbi:MAG: methyltransferase domain-containing protein [Acidimicrobiia bacterium]|nr:methyltransferase domain-containing protein [Acidimicrobiia bacterium]
MPAARSRSRQAAERRWGWHRLDESTARYVVARAGIRPGDLVVDLGAGTGALTVALVEAGARVIAVERHPHRGALLHSRCADLPVTVVNVDIGDLRLPRRRFRVVANPPWAMAESIRSMLLRSPSLARADLVLPRWLVRHWAAESPRIGIGPSIRAEAFVPPAPTGAAVAIISGPRPKSGRR